MITEFDQYKTPAGNWIVIVRSSTDNDYLSPGPRIWWETDGTGERGLTRIIESAMHIPWHKRKVK